VVVDVGAAVFGGALAVDEPGPVLVSVVDEHPAVTASAQAAAKAMVAGERRCTELLLGAEVLARLLTRSAPSWFPPCHEPGTNVVAPATASVPSSRNAVG
jgi:hypothetical protein